MMNKQLAWILPLLLTACAGGGNVGLPVSVAPYPKSQPIDLNNWSEENNFTGTDQITPVGEIEQGNGAGKVQSFNTAENVGSPTIYNVKINSFNDKRVLYKSASGKLYSLGNSSSIIIPSTFSPDQNVPTKHDAQIAEEGKVIACCANASASFTPGSTNHHMIYGAWIDNNNTPNLFASGIMADLSKMQGASDNGGLPKGKAVYSVLGFRVKNGEIVSSTHNNDVASKRPENSQSRLVANFNTGKLGGVLVGNADFGDSIDFNGENFSGSVDIYGTEFFGTAQSAGQTGAVKGAFFREDGSNIGGVVQFSDPNLSASFGGKLVGGGNLTSDDSTDVLPRAKNPYSGSWIQY